jgi:transglutaminase-like putative cysteine protease
MYLKRWFRLLEYATLGLACGCLIHAELLFMPGIEWAVPVVAVALVLAWLLQGRWLMPAWVANLLAVGIIAATAAWMVVQLRDRDSWLSNAPQPAGLVPPLGPVLTALLLVRLFRPRGPADFWLLQGMGLLQVALACVLGTGAELGMLLAAYLVCGLGCLAGHQLLAGLQAAGRPWEERWTGARLLSAALRWAAVIGAVALVLFLVTPRGSDDVWDPGIRFGGTQRTITPRSWSGFSDHIELAREGLVSLEPTVAFTVSARDDDGRPKTDLPADQRWRSTVLDSYSHGRWTTDTTFDRFNTRPQVGIPDFGPGQYFLTFTARPREAGGLFLADPVRFGKPPRRSQPPRPGEPLPPRLPVQVLVPRERLRPLFVERSGTAAPWKVQQWEEYQYRQVVPPDNLAERQRWPSEPLDPRYVQMLTRNPLPSLEAYTIRLLRRLEAEPGYDLAGALPRPGPNASERSFQVAPEQWRAVALALTKYLSHSGDFSHTVELRSVDLDLDPVVDFLTNVRSGHCERFASALALMLRALGIPCRVVKGYHGVEHQGGGNYVVLHNLAHAWVEALIPATGPDRGPDDFDWLSLDPTPDTGSTPAPPAFSLTRWWETSKEAGLQLWRDLIVEYNPDQQADLMKRLKAAGWAEVMKVGLPLGGVVVLLAAAAWLRRRRRRRQRAAQRGVVGDSLYGRLVALLMRHLGLAPAAGQTPREFGQAAGEALRGRPATAALADVPAAVVELFYRVRFGGRPLEEAERQALDARLDALAAALR